MNEDAGRPAYRSHEAGDIAGDRTTDPADVVLSVLGRRPGLELELSVIAARARLATSTVLAALDVLLDRRLVSALDSATGRTTYRQRR